MAYVHRVEPSANSGAHRGADPDNVVQFDRRERRPAPEDSPLALVRLIEGEIIPRLLLAHQGAAPSDETARPIAASDVIQFVQNVLEHELPVLLEHIDALIAAGVGMEAIYFDLLSPAAKRLGVMWEEDECSFVDVTVGLCRLQQIARDLGDRTPPVETPSPQRSALFALTPGDQHSFGLTLVTEFFRRSGWRTVCAPDASTDELRATVAAQSFDVVGFSMSDEQWLEPLPAVIAAVRLASRNPAVRVIVGGRVFTDQPDRAALVGADGMAADARQAVHRAAALADRPVRLA